MRLLLIALITANLIFLAAPLFGLSGAFRPGALFIVGLPLFAFAYALLMRPQTHSEGSRAGALRKTLAETAQKVEQAENSLKILQHVLNYTEEYIYVMNPEDGTFIYMNNKAIERYALTRDNIQGKVCWELLQPGQTARCQFCPLQRLLKSPKEPIVWEEYDRASNRYYRNTDRLIPWVDGRTVHLQHAVEITEAKKTEKTLARRLEQQELMSVISQSFISAEDMLTLVGGALKMAGEFMGIGKILFARHAPEEDALMPEYEWYSDTSPCLRLEKTVVPFRPGTAEYDSFIVQGLAYIAVNDVSQHAWYAHTRAHGLKALLEAPLIVFGKFWGMLSFGACDAGREWTASDIQLVRLLSGVIAGVVERSIKREELYRMSSIVESSPHYISYVNKDGTFEYFNQGVIAHTGYSAEELRTGGLRLIFDGEIYNRAVNELIPAILKNNTHEFELPIRCKDGRIKLMLFSGFTAQTQTVGIGIIATDITQQRQMELDIRAARDQAERSSRAKSEFLSRMSHEMRTPMNAIIGMAAIGLGSGDLEKKHYSLKKINDASTHLLGIINDILDMSKIEADKFELSPTEFSVENMLMRVLTVTSFRLAEKKQQLNLAISPDLPYSIIADEQRLAQVVANLLSNAIKFTPANNSISIAANLLESDGEECVISISVTDTGIGISQENQAKLFQSFEQADGSISRKYGGTGLGLAISKRIIELMGGSITVESEEGRGSTFSFAVKVKRGAATYKSLLEPGLAEKDLHILVVDGDAEVREYFLNLAAASGISCLTAKDAHSARKLLQKAAPNLFFIAEKMPGFNGMEFVRRNKDAIDASHVVLMLDQTEWEEARQKAKAGGFENFLVKPPLASPIINKINKIMGGGKLSGTSAFPNAMPPGCFAGHKILLAEDVAINQEIVISLLEGSGVIVECANNGREAVEKFKAAPDVYSVILMDIHMPEVDGYEATRQIRTLDTPRAKSIPIVAMTANVFKEDIEHSLAAGMNGHIGKPIDIKILFAKLQEFCA